MVDHVQIGIPEGALDVKRALTERAIFFSAEGRVPVGCAALGGREGALKKTLQDGWTG
jgi:hypothetical protein